ncbi:MAG: hypothetical protein E7212_11775 [Clostridium sartagoforme]|nr:hypothetical protein [Clostridium sartagoforme]
MRINKILLGLILVTLTTTVGCSTSVSKEDNVIDSIVIDEDVKETVNSNNVISIAKALTTENLNESRNGAMLTGEGKLIDLKVKEDFGESKGTIYQSQFPKLYVENLSIGTITNEIKENRNIVNWEEKEIDGQVLIEYMGSADTFKILKDDKVYMLDSENKFKEITSYKKIIEKIKENINRFEISYDKNLDIYYLDNSNNKLGLIDTLNDKYYEINKNKIGNVENKRLNILTAEENKIYVSITDTENKAPSILGYIENNKLTTFFDEKTTIKVKVTGDVIYSNNNILFSGYVEDDYGIWNYNIGTKRLDKQLELEYTTSYFKVSRDKSFIIFTNTNSFGKYNISIARINDNLQISNIQELTNSILPNISDEIYYSITGWSNNYNNFYVQYVISKTIDGVEKVDDVYYEIYEVK